MGRTLYTPPQTRDCVPLKESTVRRSEKALRVPALEVVDSAAAGELLWLEAEPGLPGVEIREVAQGKTSRETHVALHCFRNPSRAEETLEIDPVWFHFLQVLKNSNPFTGVNQRDGHSNSARPEQGEKHFVKSILVVYHSAHGPRLQLRRVYSGLQVVSAILLGLPLKIMHVDQHLQLAPHLEEGCRIQDDKVAGGRVGALHKRDQVHIRHLPPGGGKQGILF